MLPKCSALILKRYMNTEKITMDRSKKKACKFRRINSQEIHSHLPTCNFSFSTKGIHLPNFLFLHPSRTATALFTTIPSSHPNSAWAHKLGFSDPVSPCRKAQGMNPIELGPTTPAWRPWPWRSRSSHCCAAPATPCLRWYSHAPKIFTTSWSFCRKSL